MRPLIFALAIAAMAAPVAALADDGPPAAPNPAAMQQHMAAFAQVHQQIETLHKQERAQFLAALSPAHKQLLAQVAGELAISPSPDFQGAARKLDASLSSSESQAILRAHASYHQQERAIMENAMLDIQYDVPYREGVKECKISDGVILRGEEPALMFEKDRKTA